MRFGFASPSPPPAAPPLPINLAADDTEDDDDLESPRPVVLPRPRSAQQSPSPRVVAVAVAAPAVGKRPASKSRKRSFEQASRGGSDSISNSDDSYAEAQKPRVTGVDVDANANENSFLTPSPVRIARRKKQGLHFFMDMNSRQRALQEQQTSGGDSDAASVCAPRTLICNQHFGRCEVHFGDGQVDLLLWKPSIVGCETRVWHGGIKYSQLARFCLSSGKRAPYLLLLEIEASAKGYTPFAQFFDPLFARWSQDHADVLDSHLYGAVFVFDEELDYARCRSIGESIAELRGFFQRTIPEEEAQWYLKLDRSRQRDRECDRRVWRQEAISTNGGDAVSRSASASPELPQLDAQPSLQNDTVMLNADVGPAVDGSTVNLSDDCKEEQSEAPTVIVLQTQDSASSADANAAQKAAIADSRHQVALLYPYDGSETLGRVSVTFGDIKRLAPGEFLNDNIIDFYLRFLWRHCEPWQQHQMYFFSSYFFTQLKPPRDRTLTAQERYARVARWTQKETDLFNKRFLFIPINDSFHWSIAVFCNPGSAVVTKRRRRKPRQRPSNSSADTSKTTEVIDVEGDPFGYFRAEKAASTANTSTGFALKSTGEVSNVNEAGEKAPEFIEEELEESRSRRREYPPCVLFLDSLRCHRKKKFSTMLREYLECEWNARNPPPIDPEPKAEGVIPTGPDGTIDQPATVDDDDDEEEAQAETIVTSFDVDSIGLVAPDIPRQTNSSDCGVFLLMYAAEVVRRFPAGVTREDLETNMSTSLTPDMFDAEHVREFRDYVHQLIFCLRALEKRGLREELVKDEKLEWFTIDG